MEFTVVHELVHLELSSLTKNFKSRSEESYSGEEQAVNRMADALLKLDNPAR
jgi:Zn-dependent peptidase ImmA (M78 family)